MAAHDAKYFQRIYNSIDFFRRNREATICQPTNIYKYYDLRILKDFAPTSLHGYPLSEHDQFDRMVDYLYGIQVNPKQEPEELRRLRDENNPQVFLSEESVKKREEIASLPEKQQAPLVKDWVAQQTTALPKQTPRIIKPLKPEKKTEKEKEAEETEEVPKEQAAQQPEQPQPPPVAPHPPAGGPSAPRFSVPRISIQRPTTLFRERFGRRITGAPRILGGGLRGAGGRIAPLIGNLGNFALSNGGKLLNSGANAIQRLGGLRSSTAANFKKATSRRVILAVLLLLLGGGLITGLLPGGVLNPTGSLLTTGGDIAACKFTRGDQKPPEASYKSPLLLQYLNEASQLSGIPTVVLAAFMRVESPSATLRTDEEIQNLGCAVSSTGALGIMQIQPQGTKGHDERAVTNGAKLIGKKYEELIKEDYCDVRKSIIMGAGFLLEKLRQRHYGDGSRWDPQLSGDKDAIYALVEGYYGCLEYGGLDNEKCDGPYNYGEDVWKSINECKSTPSFGTVTSPTADHPNAPQVENNDLRQAIIDKFSITMNGFNPNQLQWAWEKFWEVSNTNFINLTKGSTITAASGTTSEQTGCRSVRVGSAFSDPTLFKIVLTHELGHVIYWCNDDLLSRRSEHHNIFSSEGGVTGYGASGCLGTPPHTEDYAEMIAYYLNQGVVEQTARCNNRGQVPFEGGRFPLHLNLVISILGNY